MQVGKMPEIRKNSISKWWWHFLEKYWHNPQIFKSRYRYWNASLESRIIWWSLGLGVLTRSRSRSIGLDCISGRYSDSIERMRWCTSKACKYKKRKYNVDHDGFLIKCNSGYKNHTAYRSLIASKFSQALFQRKFYDQWWLSSKVETWNFTKYKLFKLANSTKKDLSLAGWNLNSYVQEKKTRQTHVSWMMLWK